MSYGVKASNHTRLKLALLSANGEASYVDCRQQVEGENMNEDEDNGDHDDDGGGSSSGGSGVALLKVCRQKQVGWFLLVPG